MRFVRISGVKVGGEIFGMFKFGSREPRVFFVSTFITYPSNVVKQFASTSTIKFRLKYFSDFILEFALNFNRRRRRSRPIGDFVGRGWL